MAKKALEEGGEPRRLTPFEKRREQEKQRMKALRARLYRTQAKERVVVPEVVSSPGSGALVGTEHLTEVDMAMFLKARTGDVAAARLMYMRFLGNLKDDKGLDDVEPMTLEEMEHILETLKAAAHAKKEPEGG